MVGLINFLQFLRSSPDHAAHVRQVRFLGGKGGVTRPTYPTTVPLVAIFSDSESLNSYANYTKCESENGGKICNICLFLDR